MVKGIPNLGREFIRRNLIQRDDCNSLLELSILDQVLSDLLVLYDDIIKLSARGDLQGRCLVVVLLLE